MRFPITILLFFFTGIIHGQEKISFMTPPASPEASFTQQLVKGEITVSYSRPLARGRKVFGGLVPFDSLWRTGAGGAPTINLTEEMIVGDKLLGPGKYAVFTIPGQKEWIIIINADTTLHGTSGYDSKKDLYRFKLQSEKEENFREAFVIEVSDLNRRGEGFISLIWENTKVRIPLKSPIDEKVMATITTRLISNKEKNPELFYQAANYYYVTGRDLDQAATWVLEAENADKENFNYPNLLQKIYADLKNYKSAIQAAKRAIEIGEKKNLTSAVTGLKKRVAEWEKK